ncbi:hypothetical protein NSB25_07480 [Acetatifactor muris]|uniref:Lipoprotein n=1 Tax=Acetatifactor muris TaxID=879566 RepID=A0A2K4ZE36_9FIRM|nr:hypothetical protein [Acetatifactor muris]MCR2047115.1 hypothetical protein [Acetatifactor muris]SOY28722.1 hypothetical protein AMURIS_01433 [Acetatifactor muris]
MNNNRANKTKFHALKSGTATSLCLAAVLSLSGCSLALEEAPSQPGQDRLAGVFVTREYIRQGTPEIEMNSRGEITFKETNEKIYGTLNRENDSSQPPIVFPGLEGYGLYCLEFPEKDFDGTGITINDGEERMVSYYTGDDFFTDLHFSSTDQEEGAEGSLYVSADTAFNYFFNPVYQQEDGQVYLLPGTGISTDYFVDGQQYSHDTAQSISRNMDGREKTKSYRFKVSIVSAAPPVDTELLFMGENHQLLKSLSAAQLDAFFEKEVPELELPADVAYLILQQKTKDGVESTHQLFDRGSEILTYMVPAENHMLRELQIYLTWQDAAQ